MFHLQIYLKIMYCPKYNSTELLTFGKQTMRFWQNQCNFPLWCATTGSGVDYENLLKADGMIGLLFMFHVYYQTRRTLFEISAALPQNQKLLS